MDKKNLTLTIELKGVKEDFNPRAYASGVAYRGHAWAEKVTVKYEDKEVMMQAKE